MLSQAFTKMPKEVWECAPATTNAVERSNLHSKPRHVVNLKEAMTRLYKIDKSFCLKYTAASENIRLSYTNATLENNAKQAFAADLLSLQIATPDKISKFARGSVRQKIVASSHQQRKQKLWTVNLRVNVPDSSLMMKTCEVDDKWYKGTIKGFGTN